MRKYLFWLSDKQWKRIEPHLPTDIRGVERADDRRVISGIVHVLKSGCRWCDCPHRSTDGGCPLSKSYAQHTAKGTHRQCSDGCQSPRGTYAERLLQLVQALSFE